MNKLIQEIHENAVKHGWWETERPMKEVLSLINSEWAEALEEYRANRPMVWHNCLNDTNGKTVPCEQQTECIHQGKCYAADKKPEGIAVELADGIIRIFDLFGWMGVKLRKETSFETIAEKYGKDACQRIEKETVPELVFDLTEITCRVSMNPTDKDYVTSTLMLAVAIAGMWINGNGEDPMKLIEDKNAFNKTRPYKHGKVC